MKQRLAMGTLVACLAVVPGGSQADWLSGQGSPSPDAEVLNGTRLLPAHQINAERVSGDSGMAATRGMTIMHSLEACISNRAVCIPTRQA